MGTLFPGAAAEAEGEGERRQLVTLTGTRWLCLGLHGFLSPRVWYSERVVRVEAVCLHVSAGTLGVSRTHVALFASDRLWCLV